MSNTDALIRAAIHDLQARLGSIHIAVTAVAQLDLDRDARAAMLESASEESVRASAELAAVGALASCLLDASPRAECDLGASVAHAVDLARVGGITVDASVADPSKVTGIATRLDTVLPALLRVVAGASRRVTVACRVSRVEITRVGGDPEPLPAIAYRLVDALEADVEVILEVLP